MMLPVTSRPDEYQQSKIIVMLPNDKFRLIIRIKKNTSI